MEYNKKITTTALAMINIIAVANLRGIPFSAKLGTNVLYYYAIAALAFYIPTALITAELATAWPNRGGIYIWVREAFGEFSGFLTIWLQWIYNVVWYPTILTFVAANVATLIDPALAHNAFYTWFVITILFWLCTLLNYHGLRFSSAISTIGTILGTVFPMMMIMILGGLWYMQHGSPHLATSTQTSTLGSMDHLTFFSFIIFGLVGIEMSAVHASEVNQPKRAYPLAILYASIAIFTILILASLAVIMVVDPTQLSVTTGVIQAFSMIFAPYHNAYLLPAATLFIVLGSISSVVTWIIGPTKGLLAASHDQCLPKWFAKTNAQQVPVHILLVQAVVFTALSFCYLCVPNVEGVYEVLSLLTTQLALFVYVLMFAAAIKLRLKNRCSADSFQVPGGIIGLSFTATVGIVSSIIVVAIGFIPPPELHYSGAWYELTMAGLLLVCLAPTVFLYRQAKKQSA